jgi:hypothetical protein
MRLSEGARKINRQGGAIYIHDETAIVIKPVAEIPLVPLAPIEILDFVYGRLIALSSAERYRGTLIFGEKGLLRRGFDADHFGNYGALPAKWYPIGNSA